MRMSHHFGETLRVASADTEIMSHELLLRAGYIRPLAAGIFSYLPLGLRSIQKIEQIIREEMNTIGGQEILLPMVHPAELWQATGRWYQIGEEMGRFRDRAGRDMVLGMTHEEVISDLVRRDIHSYRQLPVLLYQIQTKFRDEPRPRAGLIRVREFTMKDSYSLDTDQAGLEQQYRNHYTAYFRIFSRAGIYNVRAVNSDTGMMGGKLAHEYMFLSPVGEDTLALCNNCGYAANLQVALFGKPTPVNEEHRPLEKIATPGRNTIRSLAEFLGEPEAKLAKVVFFTAAIPAPGPEDSEASREVLVLALIRGDMQINETKLGNALKARWLRPATPVAIRAVGAEPGYASPIGIVHDSVVVVVDDLVASSTNLVSGANEAGYHYRNVNVGRDFEADHVADLTAVTEGASCVRCQSPLQLVRGVEVGNIFQLGTRYTEALGATYLDKEGQSHPVVMGSYGIGVGRLLACIAEAHHDASGLKWPITVAPYQVYLVHIGRDNPTLSDRADELYQRLIDAGIEVLYDDREVSPGVKFADADLLGIPLRATISERSLKNGGVELKRRDAAATQIVPFAQAVASVQESIATLYEESYEQIQTFSYPGDE